MASRFRRTAFSLVELLVVLGIVVILCGIFVPYVGKMRETNRRVSCADNLRQIHAAFSKYAAANDRDFPRMPWDAARPAGYVAFTGASAVPTPIVAARPATTAPTTVPATSPATVVAAPSAVAPAIGPTSQPATAPATIAATLPSAPTRPTAVARDAVQPNDVTAPLWLLVRLGYVQPQAFVCSSASETLDPMLTDGKRVAPDQRSNFTSARHLSYSYASPYSAAPRYRLNSDVLPPDFAIMADKNPGVGKSGESATRPAYHTPPLQMTEANSRNHGRAGQNVLYVTGEVRFQPTPYCGYGNGWKRDNIYTALSPTPLPPDAPVAPEGNGVMSSDVGPAWANDSYLVPADEG